MQLLLFYFQVDTLLYYYIFTGGESYFASGCFKYLLLKSINSNNGGRHRNGYGSI